MTADDRTSAWRIELDADDATAYAALATDRLWNGYSIADLDPPFRAYARIALARRGQGPPEAACLLLRHPDFTSLIPHGNLAGLTEILAMADLPAAATLLAWPQHLPAFERYYVIAEGRPMLRLAADRLTFLPPELPDPAVERLARDNLPALLDLYTGYEGNAFNPDQLGSGPFYGVRSGHALLAAGGIQAVSARFGIGAIGNYYTRPEVRGRGYGTAIVAAVVGELLAGRCQDIILNVAADNAVARRLYGRLGFRVHCEYSEGRVVRR